MFYWFSKILTFAMQPSSLAALAMAQGIRLLVRRPESRWGRRLAWGGLAWYVIAGLSPLPNALVMPLEERFAHLPAPQQSDKFKGIIILGGFEDGSVSNGRGQLAVNEAAERLMQAVLLAKDLPDTKVVFTGGVGSMWGGEEATGPVSRYLMASGIAADRIVIEGRSRSTYENGVFSAEILTPKPGERWLIVTSAYHMPRAIGVFRKAGFDVTAYPVDYQTRDAADLTTLSERIPSGLLGADLAVREWVGLVAYRATGRTDELLPGP